MDSRKQAICDALRAFIERRPGFEFANYGDAPMYRRDQKTAQRQLHDARALLRQVELSDGITADAMLAAADGRGRLTIRPPGPDAEGRKHYTRAEIGWCTGQYWSIEFRAGVARYLASLLWDYKREHCMPPPITTPKGDRIYQPANGRAIPAGDWLRASFRREFGKGLAGRYFQ